MLSFGRLLRRLRGETPLRTVAQRAGISPGYLSNVEAGRRVPSERRARQILRRGLLLGPKEADRALLEAHLLDHGLRAKGLRELVLDLAGGHVPEPVRRELLALYRSHRKG